MRSDDNLVPKISFSDTEMNFLKTLVVSESESIDIEKNTTEQSLSEKWFEMRTHRITSSNAHPLDVINALYGILQNFATLEVPTFEH